MKAQMLEIAKRRLKESSPLGPHPDENLLTGFVEGVLTENMRTRVLRHLLACRQCRGVVAFSRPEEVKPIMTLALFPKGYWPRWLSLRWAGAIATVALIVSGAWIGRAQLATMFRVADTQFATIPAGGGSEGAADHFAMQATEERKEVSLQRRAPSAVPAAGSMAVAGSQKRPPVATAGSKIAADRIAGRLENQEPATKIINGSLVANYNRATPLFSTAGTPGSTPLVPMWPEKISPSVGVGFQASRPLPPARTKPVKWMVSKSGMLYQSFDDGLRWQLVAVREDAELRSVSAVGSDIWVGGKSGELFQSTDRGRRWTKVVPSTKGMILQDDIERVEFTDANHGRVTTISGNTWITADRGETWEMQEH